MKEKDLVQKIIQGDEAARSRVYQDYYVRLYRTCVYFLGSDDSDVEDVVQETFIAIYNKAGQFEFRSSFYTWMNQICVNLCFQRLRQRKKLLSALEVDLETFSTDSALQQHWDDENARARREEVGIVEGLKRGLDEPCRRLLELRDGQRKSYAQISRLLKRPLGTVMSRLARCRQALRDKVKEILLGTKP